MCDTAEAEQRETWDRDVYVAADVWEGTLSVWDADDPGTMKRRLFKREMVQLKWGRERVIQSL